MKRFIPITAALLALACPAVAQTYIYVDLGAAPYSDTFGASAHNDQQVGYGVVGGQQQALVWNNIATNATVLPATGYTQVQATHLFQTFAVGNGLNAGSQSTPLLWKGLAGEPLALNPSFATSSNVKGISAELEGVLELAGSATLLSTGQQVAVTWKGAVPSPTNINPSGATSSQCNATSSSYEAGLAVFSGQTHAYFWAIGATSADLHPTGAQRSEALGIHSGFGSGTSGFYIFSNQAGDYTTSSGAVHACFWNMTAQSMVDLHPATGYSSTTATDILASPLSTLALKPLDVVGYGTQSTGATVALLWTNGSNAATDLSTYLPAGTTSSRATGIDHIYGTIIGTATINGSNHAFLLMPTVAPTILSFRASHSAFVGVPYTYNVVARSVPSPTYSATNLPPGLSISPTTGVISGTPTTLGSYTGSVKATNTISGAQKLATQSFTITVVAQPGFLQAGVIGSLDPANGTGKHQALVVATDGNFYGTSSSGGAGSNGTIFQMTPGGSQTTIHAFGDGSVVNDGALPNGLTLYSDGSLYGTTYAGGSAGYGTLFHTSQGATTTFVNFAHTNGAHPIASPLLMADGTLYGTTGGGATTSQVNGTTQGYIYSISPTGDYSSGAITGYPAFTGYEPLAAPDTPITQTTLGLPYCTTAEMSGGRGTAYSMAYMPPLAIRNFNGFVLPYLSYRPHTPLTPMSDGSFYGITSAGGTSWASSSLYVTSDPATYQVWGMGAVYKLTGGGSTTQTDLRNFGDGTVANDGANNADPGAPLVVGDDGFLYGVTPKGGSANQGCFFQIGTTGGMTVLHSFGDSTVPNDGQIPGPAFIKSKSEVNTFYVMTEQGGANGNGAICRFSVGWAPKLTDFHNVTAGTTFSPAPIGLTYTNSLAVTGNPAPTFGVKSGTLPPGFTLSSNGVVSGTFTTAGTSTGTISCTNGVSPDDMRTFTFIAKAKPIPVGTVGTPYSFSFFSVSTGLSYSATPGALPPGLSLSSVTAGLSGTPTVLGIYSGTVTGTNATITTTQPFSITITGNYSAWASTHFTSDQMNDPTVSGAAAIPQSDGVPNLLKFLYDMDPTVHLSDADRAALPVAGIDATTTPGTSYLTLTYRSSPLTSGLQVAVQTSTDLQSWTTVTPDITKTLSTNPTTGDSTIEVEVNTNGNPREYIRLYVTTP